MARGRKKESALTPEEKLAQVLVPVEEHPHKVPENWVWSYIRSGYEVTSSKRVHKDDWLSEGIPFYRTRELVKLSENGYVDNELFIAEEQYEEYKTAYGVPQMGDLLISGVGTIGVPYIVDSEEKFYFKDGNIIWFKNRGLFLPKYIYFLYKSLFIDNQIHKMSSGTTVDTYTIINANNTMVPVPPVAEQRRIVDRIEYLFAKLDEAKEKAQSVLDSFETRKAAILHKAFTGELTAKWRAEHSVDIVSWKETVLQDVCEKIVCGKTPTGHITDQGEIPYLKVYNIVNNHIDFLSTPQFIPNSIHSSKLHSSILKPNDVIMNIVGPPLRKIAIIPDTYPEWNMNQAIVRFRPLADLQARFLYYALINPETLDDVIAATKGVVGQANISVSQSRNLVVNLPSVPEQQEIVRILDSLFSKEQQAKEAAEAVLEKIDLLKKSILARAFRGELGTNDPTEESAVELLKEAIR